MTAASFLSPVRIRYIASTGRTKIFPSPTWPVEAERKMASTVSWTKGYDTLKCWAGRYTRRRALRINESSHPAPLQDNCGTRRRSSERA